MLALTCLFLLAVATSPTDAVAATAPFGFSATLGNRMVLQHPAVVWGTGTPGTSVTTTVTPSAATKMLALAPPLMTTVDATGLWRQPLPNSGDSGFAEFNITSITAGVGAKVLTGVLFGRVIMCRFDPLNLCPPLHFYSPRSHFVATHC